MGDIWGGGGGSSSSGGSGGGDIWGGSSGGSRGGGGFGLHSITGALGKVGETIANVGEGIGGTALDVVRSPYVLIDEMGSGKNDAGRMADYNKRLPFLAGLAWGGEKGGSGLAQTIGEAGGKSLLGSAGSKVVPIGQAYGSNPVSAALNDIANLTMLAGPGAAAAGAAAGGGDAARLGAIASGAETPGVLGRTAMALQSVADAPGLPLRAGKSALVNAAQEAITSGAENPGLLARLGTKLTPEYKGLIGNVLEGKAQERAAVNIINNAATNEEAIAGLRSAGLNDAADAIDAARHTGAPPPVMSNNFADVQAGRAAAASAPAAAQATPELLGVPRFAKVAESPNLVGVPETVTGHEIATALHEAGFHNEGNAFMAHGAANAVQPRIDVVKALGANGFGKAADLLVAPQMAQTTGADVIAGLERMAKQGAPTAKAAEAAAVAPRTPPIPAGASEAAAEVPAGEARQAAIGAIRSVTGSKMETLPGVSPEYQPGLVPLDKVTNETLPAQGYVPKTLEQALSPRFTPPADVHGSSLLGLMDPANHAYAQARLNLNPATLMGRLGGHTSLTALGAPHPLDSLMEALRGFTGKLSPDSERILSEDAASAPGVASRLGKGGPIPQFQGQLAEDVADKPGAVSRATSKLDTLANKSPISRWAAKMDDALRKGVYLAERKAGVGAQDALTTVNRVLGEFDNLSPAEQAIARRLAPFYNWHKQIGLIATHLAEDNPAKAVLLAHLGDTGLQLGNQPGGTPGELQIAGHAISPDFLVPFGEAGTTFKNLGTPMLGPVPKAVYGLTGQNPNTGKTFTGPNASKGQDYRYEGIGQNLLKSAPQLGLLNSLLDAARGNQEVVRYNSGAPVISKGGQIPTGSSPLDAALSFGGLRSENLKAAQERTAAVAAKAAKLSGGGSSKGGKTKAKSGSIWGG